jgi:hypothetical protein
VWTFETKRRVFFRKNKNETMFLLLRYLSSTRLLSSLSTRRTKKNETRCRAGGPARRERGTRIVSPDLSGRLPAALDSSSPERSMTELCRLFRALLRPVLDCFLLSRRYFSPGCRWTQLLRRKIFVRVVIVTVGFGHVYSGGLISDDNLALAYPAGYRIQQYSSHPLW